MKELNELVVSFELSLVLRKLGVNQESLFYWDIDSKRVIWPFDEEGTKMVIDPNHFCSAFTVAELGKLLPTDTYSFKRDLKWQCLKHDIQPTVVKEKIQEDKEADARAKMLIHCIENSLVKIK